MVSHQNHPHPRPALRHLTARLILLGGIGLVIGGALQIVLALALWPAGLLFCGTLLFTAVLFLPLVIQSVLYPEITVEADGLRLRPMLWRAQFVPRSALLRIAPNPLVRDNPTLGRLLHGRNYRPREAVIILIGGEAALLPFYRLVIWMTGSNDAGQRVGRAGQAVYGFALSTTAQADYPALLRVISAWLDG